MLGRPVRSLANAVTESGSTAGVVADRSIARSISTDPLVVRIAAAIGALVAVVTAYRLVRR